MDNASRSCRRFLPTVNATASIEVQQINLAAYGLKFSRVQSHRRTVSGRRLPCVPNAEPGQCLGAENYIAAKHNFEGSKLTAEDARDLVVLTVGNAYLLCIADAARLRQ